MELTDQERRVLSLLAEAWNEFLKLPSQHPMEQHEFCHAIHQAQQKVMIRPVVRAEGWVKSAPEKVE